MRIQWHWSVWAEQDHALHLDGHLAHEAPSKGVLALLSPCLLQGPRQGKGGQVRSAPRYTQGPLLESGYCLWASWGRAVVPQVARRALGGLGRQLWGPQPQAGCSVCMAALFLLFYS